MEKDVINLNDGIAVAMGRLFVCAMLVLGFQASSVLAAPAGVGSSHHTDIESDRPENSGSPAKFCRTTAWPYSRFEAVVTLPPS